MDGWACGANQHYNLAQASWVRPAHASSPKPPKDESTWPIIILHLSIAQDGRRFRLFKQNLKSIIRCAPLLVSLVAAAHAVRQCCAHAHAACPALHAFDGAFAMRSIC